MYTEDSYLNICTVCVLEFEKISDRLSLAQLLFCTTCQFNVESMYCIQKTALSIFVLYVLWSLKKYQRTRSKQLRNEKKKKKNEKNASGGKRILNSLMPACVRGLESYLSEWVAATVYVNFTPQETKTFPFSQIVDWQWTSRKEEIEFDLTALIVLYYKKQIKPRLLFMLNVCSIRKIEYDVMMFIFVPDFQGFLYPGYTQCHISVPTKENETSNHLVPPSCCGKGKISTWGFQTDEYKSYF